MMMMIIIIIIIIMTTIQGRLLCTPRRGVEMEEEA